MDTLVTHHAPERVEDITKLRNVTLTIFEIEKKEALQLWMKARIIVEKGFSG